MKVTKNLTCSTITPCPFKALFIETGFWKCISNYKNNYVLQLLHYLFIIPIFYFQSKVPMKKQIPETMLGLTQSMHGLALLFPLPRLHFGAKRQLLLSLCTLVNHRSTQFRKSNCCSLMPIKGLCV
jgi:hypothetical protein